MATMKEFIVGLSGVDGEVVDSPIPKPEAKQVVIKVVVSGTNPKDWKYPHLYQTLLKPMKCETMTDP